MVPYGPGRCDAPNCLIARADVREGPAPKHSLAGKWLQGNHREEGQDMQALCEEFR